MSLSFRTRLSLGHMAAVALILAVVAAGADWLLSRVVLRFVDGELLDLAHIEAAALPPEPTQGVRIHEAPATAPPSFIRLDKFVQIIRLDGEIVAKSANLGPARLPRPAPVLARLRQGDAVFETLETFGEEPIRLLSLPVHAGGTPYVIQVAISLNDVNSAVRATRWLLAAMSAAILVAVGVTGAFLARRALQPIDRIVQRAHTIGEANLGERLPHPGSRDEIGRLVETLNEMLARIERSVETQRRFTGDASHELLSPLSRLRAELEVALRRPRDPMEYQETLASCLEEVERLSRLTGEMLMLARLDAGESGAAMSAPGRLGLVLDQVMARLEPEARRREVSLDLESASDLKDEVASGRRHDHPGQRPRQRRQVLAAGRPRGDQGPHGRRPRGDRSVRFRSRSPSGRDLSAVRALPPRVGGPCHQGAGDRTRPGHLPCAGPAAGRSHHRREHTRAWSHVHDSSAPRRLASGNLHAAPERLAP